MLARSVLASAQSKQRREKLKSPNHFDPYDQDNDWFFAQFDQGVKKMTKVAIAWMVFVGLFAVAMLVTVVLLLLHFFG